MRRYYGKRDANHVVVKEALQAVGWMVCDTHMVGGGFPDMVVGKNGKTVLLEVKNKAGRNRVDKAQIEFRDLWRGDDYIIVYNEQEAVEMLEKLIKKE